MRTEIFGFVLSWALHFYLVLSGLGYSLGLNNKNPKASATTQMLHREVLVLSDPHMAASDLRE